MVPVAPADRPDPGPRCALRERQDRGALMGVALMQTHSRDLCFSVKLEAEDLQAP